jgi:uncharacterized protein YdaU (DUF1376 family)
MNKPPAYQYYASDFEQGTADFTIEEVGIYQRLLNFEWTNGAVPNDMKKLSIICRCTTKKFLKYWTKVETKFEKNGEGNFFNKRMEFEREKQRSYREKQSLNAKHRFGSA